MRPSAPGGCPAATRDAVAAVGDPTGDVWLHLLGLALENGAGDAADFVGEVDRTTPIDLRRHLLGLHVPSWRRAAGRATIERAARGDADACEQLAVDVSKTIHGAIAFADAAPWPQPNEALTDVV